jgi:signal transduction histidine kinase/CheY-like chemotaxis protein
LSNVAPTDTRAITASGKWHRWVLAPALAIPVLEAAWLHWEVGGPHATLVFSNLIGVLTPTIATAACWVTGSRERGEVRRAWRLLGLGTFSWAMGQAVWSWYELLGDRQVPFPSLADVGYLGLIPLATLALLGFRVGPRARKVRVLLDGVLIGGAVLFVSWATVLAPMYRSPSGGLLEQVLTLAYPLGDIVLVTAVVFAAAHTPASGRMAFGLVGAGLVSLGVADSAFGLLTLHQRYATGSPIDPFWDLGFMLIALGALRHRPLAPGRQPPSRSSAWRNALLPYAPILLACVVAAWKQIDRGALEPVLFWTIILLVLVGSVRHCLTLADNEVLEQAVEARVRERAALEARLHQAERLEGLGQLAGGVAHDFNNLLMAILNCADFALAALPDPPPAGMEKMCDGIRSDVGVISWAAQRGADLTNQLLVFARRDHDEPRVLELGELMGEVEDLLRRTIGEHIALEIDLRHPLWPVRVDPRRLEQVLVNLAVNARDAMEGGGRLTISAEDVELGEGTAAGLPPGRYLCVTEVDTGCGMTPDVRARAFEPFFTTKPKGQGTGLGLATVFGIVAGAGGTVILDSEPGRGTAVRVYLPAVCDAPLEPRGVRAGSYRPGEGETILVVEDEAVVRDVACRILGEHGYEVVVATDAADALRICVDPDRSVDLLLTDVVMPGLSGPELVSQLRTLRPGTPALLMSGYPGNFLVPFADDTHGTEVVGKPFTATILLEKVRNALAQTQGSPV